MILLADSGSTKTDWRLVYADKSHQQILTDGINPYYETESIVAKTLTDQLCPHLPQEPIEAVYFYGTGCTGPEPSGLVQNALQSCLSVAGPIEVASDLLGAARATCGREPGVVAILGTGSNISAYNGHDLTGPGLSLGFWLGDEGSGGHMGKTLIQSFLLGKLPIYLADIFQEQYPDLNRLTVLDRAYRQPFPNRYFASFSPFLAQHIKIPFVEDLVKESFWLFIENYALRLPNARELPIHCVGSVAEHFTRELRSILYETDCQPGQIIGSPADGLIEYHNKS